MRAKMLKIEIHEGNLAVNVKGEPRIDFTTEEG
jgi:hypothetical protein